MSRIFALYIIGVLLFALVFSRNALAFNVCVLFIGMLSILWWYGVGIYLRYFLIVFRFVQYHAIMQLLMTAIVDSSLTPCLQHCGIF